MNGYTELQNRGLVVAPNEIILHTTAVKVLKSMGIKKPIDIVAHWTICINGWCYELDSTDNKKIPYAYATMTEQAWRFKRARQGKPVESYRIGYMAMPYSHQHIDEVASLVWERSLRKKYAFDANNCQMFVRLLIELIGSQHAKAEFPAALDHWVKTAGNVRDGSFFAFAAGASLFAAGASMVAASAGSLLIDPTGTTAAAFAVGANTVLRSSAHLLTARDAHGKGIKEGQKEIRAEMRRRGRPLAEAEVTR